MANSLNAKINGGSILENFAIKGATRGSLFRYAAVRLNGPLAPGSPKLRNYLVSVTPLVSSGIIPVDLSEMFFDPDTETQLQFKLESPVQGQAVPFIVTDYSGKEVGKGEGGVDAPGDLAVKVKLSRGYYELRFPAAQRLSASSRWNG